MADGLVAAIEDLEHTRGRKVHTRGRHLAQIDVSLAEGLHRPLLVLAKEGEYQVRLDGGLITPRIAYQLAQPLRCAEAPGLHVDKANSENLLESNLRATIGTARRGASAWTADLGSHAEEGPQLEHKPQLAERREHPRFERDGMHDHAWVGGQRQEPRGKHAIAPPAPGSLQESRGRVANPTSLLLLNRAAAAQKGGSCHTDCSHRAAFFDARLTPRSKRRGGTASPLRCLDAHGRHRHRPCNPSRLSPGGTRFAFAERGAPLGRKPLCHQPTTRVCLQH
mmetsp:Transcript_12578/g.41699  ORF Transcript_12578/g.41699 Transcript_12578/m.41699 type:complete len:280 (-) Transcript_12578:855-1694(-)